MKKSGLRRLDGSAAIILLSAGLAALVLGLAIPPFQFPDEPHHFAALMIEARGEGQADAVERETIEMMDRYDWWGLVGMGRPAVLPKRISEIQFLMAGLKTDDFRARIPKLFVYYKSVGLLLRTLGSQSFAANYYIARSVSIAFYFGALVLLFLSVSGLVKHWGPEIGWAMPLAAFIPQAAFIAIGVAPDSLALFLSACFFKASIELISGMGNLRYAMIALISGGLGFSTDRSSMVLGALIVLLPLFVVRRKTLAKIVPATLVGLIASILLLYFLFLRFPIQLESEFRWFQAIFRNSGRAVVKFLAFEPFSGRFWLQLSDTMFLRFGWMHFGLPWATWVWRFVELCAIGGLALGMIGFMKRKARKVKTGSEGSGRLIAFFITAVVLQTAALWLYYGFSRILPQGRYLFPILIPLAVLLTVGLRSLTAAVGEKLGRMILPAFIVFEIFVWIYAFWVVVLPVFRLTVRSPYPGA